jgi:hypothetical protein
MAFDTLTITIDDDGTIHTSSDAVSGANHSNAEQFLRHMATLAGGTTTRVRRSDVHHSHTHSHSHGEHEHSHE